MHTFAKLLIMFIACLLGLVTFAHPSVRLRFNVSLFFAVIVFGLAGCSTTHAIPARVEDGGVNMDGTHVARCAVMYGATVVLTEESCRE